MARATTWQETFGFTTVWDVGSLRSIGHLVPQAPAKRCGLYVLEFADGARYAGQAVDVARRFLQHRGRFDDIERVWFKPVPRRNLDERERLLIRALDAAGASRNIVHGSAVPEVPELDLVFPTDQQQRWLNDPSSVPASPERIDDPKQRAKYVSSFRRFQANPHADAVVAALRRYVRRCVPAWQATELTYWSLSCLPSTGTGERLACLSINTMEVLTVLAPREDPSFTYAFIVVSGSDLLAAHASLEDAAGEVGADDVDVSDYAAGGADQARLWFSGIGRLLDALAYPTVTRAARSLNLRLMRKGPTLQWRSHALPLTDLLH